jgi:predicted RNase H-like HicB family nuclease
MNVLYSAVFEYDKSEKRYAVHFPDLPEAITEGESLEEAMFNANTRRKIRCLPLKCKDY